jgi:hypothetical protein
MTKAEPAVAPAPPNMAKVRIDQIIRPPRPYTSGSDVLSYVKVLLRLRSKKGQSAGPRVDRMTLTRGS